MAKKKSRERPSGSALKSGLGALAAAIARWTKTEGPTQTAVPGLRLVRYHAPTKPVSAMYDVCVCVAAQGAKRVLLGPDAFVYAPGNFLVSSLQLPTVAQITEASAAKPFLGLVLTLDAREVSQLMVDGSLPPPRPRQSGRGMTCGTLTEPLLAALQRLVDLQAEPRDVPILAPVIRREITYRLLVSEQGARLRQVALAGSQGHQISRAIDQLRQRFAEPLRVEDLAASVHMSPSAFHHHFRKVTAMSPLQYQKWLRLNEARRLMLTESLNAGSAAFKVGYESPSQFSREYRRLFDEPPFRDIARLRQDAGVAVA
ncbi:MAG: AraC family transcriptional regulator [Elusimicrobia bacterium]|nr:AraC family transcriptional regulator [Elusimicrobiota bacterium]